MANKSFANVPHNILCAFDDTPILDFYKGYFDTVYIMLHPFHDEETDKPVQWKTVMNLAGFENYNQLDITLRNYIGGLKERYRNDEELKLLENICFQHNLSMPPEGAFVKKNEIYMLKALQSTGYHWIYIGDEFGWERKIEDIHKMIDSGTDIFYSHECWYTLHNEVLYTSHWDSHFTLLCSNKKIVDQILACYPFEGFYCDEKTKIYWSVGEKMYQP